MVHEQLVDGPPGEHVGADGIEFHRTGVESGSVEKVELVGQGMVAELAAEEVARSEPGPQTAVAPVVSQPLIVADDASRLL